MQVRFLLPFAVVLAAGCADEPRTAASPPAAPAPAAPVAGAEEAVKFDLKGFDS